MDVTDADEYSITATTDSDTAANTVVENAATGTLVGITASAVDSDATDAVTYTLVDSATGGSYTGGEFAVDSSSGVVSVDGAIDRETFAGASRTIYVQASSTDGSSSVQSFTVDVTNLSAQMGDASDTGILTDNITNDSTPLISGTAEALTTVQVTLTGASGAINLGSATVNSSGQWTKQVNTSLADGTYSISLVETQANGSLTTAEQGIAFTVETVKPTLASPTPTKYTATLDSTGRSVTLEFTEVLMTSVDASRFGVTVAGQVVPVTSVTISGNTVTLALGQDISLTSIYDPVTVSVSYDGNTGIDDSTGVLQDIAGNDIADFTVALRNQSTVSLPDSQSQVLVFNAGLVGTTGIDTLAYVGGVKSLIGDDGEDTVVLDASTAGGQLHSSQAWYVTAYAYTSATDLPSDALALSGSGTVYGFTRQTTPSDVAYVQAEHIQVGSTNLDVTNGVLQIMDATGQTIQVDPDAVSVKSSLRLGSGAGADTFIDTTDSEWRTDVVVYSLGETTTKAALLTNIESVIQRDATVANTVAVNVGGVTDTLTGMEGVEFETDVLSTATDASAPSTVSVSESLRVAFVGTSGSGDAAVTNGYATLDQANVGSTDVIWVNDDRCRELGQAGLIAQLPSMIITDGIEVGFRLASSDAFTTFTGTSKLVFDLGSGNVLTVLVVKPSGYTLTQAIAEAHTGDVIYINDNALDAAAVASPVLVTHENLTFIANYGTHNNNLQLELADLPNYADLADHSGEIRNIFLLGDANISVIGNQHNNLVGGNAGNNLIQGGDGNDIILSGGGLDFLYGGNGNDLLIATSSLNDFTAGSESSIVLNGGAGNDSLVVATTDNHKVLMTGGAGADTFKFGAVFSGSSSLELHATISDLSARNGDELDFTQLTKLVGTSGHDITAADIVATPSAGNVTMSMGANVLSTAIDAFAPSSVSQLAVVDSSALEPTVVLNNSTKANASNAITAGLNNADTSVYTDISSRTLSDELKALLPILDHSHL